MYLEGGRSISCPLQLFLLNKNSNVIIIYYFTNKICLTRIDWQLKIIINLFFTKLKDSNLLFVRRKVGLVRRKFV